jgi:hypothetical protein
MSLSADFLAVLLLLTSFSSRWRSQTSCAELRTAPTEDLQDALKTADSKRQAGRQKYKGRSDSRHFGSKFIEIGMLHSQVCLQCWLHWLCLCCKAVFRCSCYHSSLTQFR